MAGRLRPPPVPTAESRAAAAACLIPRDPYMAALDSRPLLAAALRISLEPTPSPGRPAAPWPPGTSPPGLPQAWGKPTRVGEDMYQEKATHCGRSEEHTSELQSPCHIVC